MPPPEDLPNPGIEPVSPALQADFLPTETSEKPKECWYYRAIQIVTLAKTHIGWLSQRNSSKVYFLPLMLQKVDFFLKSGLSIITLWINIIPWARIVWREALIMSVFLNISVLVFQGLCNQNSGLWSMLSSWFAFKWMSAQCSVYSPSREDVFRSLWQLLRTSLSNATATSGYGAKLRCVKIYSKHQILKTYSFYVLSYNCMLILAIY